jgi:hypothetical protein
MWGKYHQLMQQLLYATVQRNKQLHRFAIGLPALYGFERCSLLVSPVH